MIFNENLGSTDLDSILDGISNYTIITDQLADNLHDLQKVAQQVPEVAAKVNDAEIRVRQASSILAHVVEQYTK